MKVVMYQYNANIMKSMHQYVLLLTLEYYNYSHLIKYYLIINNSF